MGGERLAGPSSRVQEDAEVGQGRGQVRVLAAQGPLEDGDGPLVGSDRLVLPSEGLQRAAEVVERRSDGGVVQPQRRFSDGQGLGVAGR